MTQRQQTLNELVILRDHLERIESLTAQIREQAEQIEDLQRRRREEGIPKPPQLSTSMSTACREKQAKLLSSWERLPKILCWPFMVAEIATWLIFRGTVDLVDPIVLCGLMFLMMRQHKHLWTAVTCVLAGAWTFGAQFFSEADGLLALIPVFVGYGAVAFKVIHQIIQAVRLHLLHREEKEQLAQEAADYESLCARHEKNCQRIQQENDEKYTPQIQDAQVRIRDLEEHCARHRKSVESASVIHDSDKELSEVAYLVSRFETKRADTLKEALLQYDAYVERRAEEQRRADRIRAQSMIDQMNQKWESERRAQQQIEQMERDWQMRRQTEELQKMRKALEN